MQLTTKILLILLSIFISVATVSCSSSAGEDDGGCDSVMRSYVAQGKVQYLDGDYNSALSTLHKVLAAMESAPGTAPAPGDLQNTYLMLGNIHFAFGDYVRANKYYLEGLKSARKSGDSGNELIFLNDLAVVACFLGNRDDAMRYNEELALLNAADSLQQKYFHMITSAYIEQTFGNRDRAIVQMKRSLGFIDRNDLDPLLKLSPLSEISEYFEQKNMYDSAVIYLQDYERLALELRASDMVADNKRKFMRVYTKMGDSENALRYQSEYFAHIDSVMNPNRFINVSNRFHQESESRANALIRELKQTVANQKILIIIIVFFVLFLALWLVFRHKTRVANIQLFKRNREIVEIEKKVREIESSRLLPHKDSAEYVMDSNDDPETDSDRLAHSSKLKELFVRIQTEMDSGTAYCDPEFSLNKLADSVGSNTKYASRAINDHAGKNFRTFINEYRIKEARRRLLDVENYGNVTMQFLAESVGFLSTSAFNMAFKKFTGMTPSLYQKLGRDIENE